ncbi:hypothetical protein Pcinc_026254 [Petrolisthes cinctipes]|uniref:Uncharacterized protein n=1 Tax=Petrolisthes cinctipes TaxID=88211 RepID=A0AAE1F6W2_PETCI|nr:hypothetical protein Pcinc_026254 [Petrolisthes cinctipes]
MIREFPSLFPALLPAAATKQRPQLITFEFSDSSLADYFILPAQLHITSEGLHPVLHSMEEIKKSLLAVLPDLDSALLNEVVDHLVKEAGAKVPEDFKFIDYDDLPMLKPIQHRKYLDNLKKGVLLASTLTREQRQKRRKIVHITHQCTPRSLA